MSATALLEQPFVRAESVLAIPDAIEALAPIYRQHGVLVFPGLLRDDPDFLAYRADIAKLANVLLARTGSAGAPGGTDAPLPLERALTTLASRDRAAVGKLFDLGTRPAKLLSAQRLKIHPAILALTTMAFGKDALIASPSQSDTLHIFPPGEENWRYNLPEHQDYPYLLQSPRQVTFWVNFSSFAPDVGGLTFWAGSHRLGVLRQQRNEHGHFKTVITPGELAPFKQVDYTADVGDIVLMNSLTVHRSIVNRTTDGTRVVQLFRYSDLTDPQSLRMQWGSAEFRGGGLTFEAAHPDLLVS